MGIGMYNFKVDVYSIEELGDIISNNELSDNDWVCISAYQELTESFIEKYSDRVDWYHISRSQKLSESFIEKYSDRIDWCDIIVYQELSYEFMERHLYRYSLGIRFGNNIIHIAELMEKYPFKYYIDKLEHELI